MNTNCNYYVAIEKMHVKWSKRESPVINVRWTQNE